MSLFFYSGPKDRRRKPDLEADSLEKHLERAKLTKTRIHPKLSFEEILKNKTLPVSSSS
jgi:hypothetical protein